MVPSGHRLAEAGHIAFADGFSAELKQNIDAFVLGNGIDAPPAEEDPDAGPAGDPEPAQPDQAEGEDTPEETS